ncbi:serine protease AprX [Virgibacillus natechei]|uniref:Serine protease AprX n=1 Tax=Virgibacillus natechei TaxID=1216297 RepID=A0ABS4IFB8_9BACI|nr:S8 family peptidase [Virgibacillus natechei]MBP1969161.1 serine protease AprX [Virgibacillus natechei]UZD14419.1 S8 family peptidase [Virgibacillus natechei]
MSNRKRVWFEEAGRKLDPGLVKHLRGKRKEDPYETTTNSIPIPVIVYFAKDTDKDTKDDLLTTCQKDNISKLDKDLRFHETICGQLTPQMIKQIKDHGAVDRIYYDREVTSFLDIASRQIGSVDIQEQHDLTGNGVTIAVIDTGIHPHADLTNPTNRITAFKDFINDQEDPYDDNGHGTHCAGDAAGNAYQSEGLYIGPAPEASVIGVKALDQDGGGRLSTIIEGIVWCIEHKEEYNIRIISLSLGAQAHESYRDDPLAMATQDAWHEGIVVCAAAGNSGPEPETISTPAINPFIITVGSTDDQDTASRTDDHIADYSSRGPTIDSLIKPDIYSPGTDIISLLAPGSALEQQVPEQIVEETYLQLSGTSMATPICAGVIAQMLEANPNLSPNDVKSILQTTAQPKLDDLWGYIEARTAVEMAINYSTNQQRVAD